MTLGISNTIPDLSVLGNGFGGGAAAFRALASNRAMFPATTGLATANNVRQSRLGFEVPGNSDYSDVIAWYSGFGQSSGGEFPSPDDQAIRCSIEYGGSNYRSAAAQNCAINALIGIPLSGLTLEAGGEGFIVTNAVGANTGSVARIIGHGTHTIFGEGATNGTAAIDYTDGNYGKGAVAGVPTVVAGNITVCGVTNGGSGYTATPSVYAYEVQPNGTIAQKTVGNAVRTGAVITSISITSGTPPAGVAAWVAPTVVIGNAFSATTQVYGPVCITGTPSNPEAKSLIALLTSIEIGNTSADNIGDFHRNWGIVERGLRNRCGILNLASSSQTLSNFRNMTTFAKTYAALATIGLGRSGNDYCYMGAPTNDIASISEATLEGYMNEIKANMDGLGIKTDFALFLPRTTDATTPASGFDTGGKALNLNAKIISGAIASTGIGYKDPRTQLVDGGDTRLWNLLYTTDFIHPNLAGIALAENNPAWVTQFAGYGNVSTLLESGDNALLESGDKLLLEG